MADNGELEVLRLRRLFEKLAAEADADAEAEEERQARAPRLAVDNPEPELPPVAVARPQLDLVVDNDADDAQARALNDLFDLATVRSREVLSKPLDPNDPHYVALLKFLSSTFGTTVNAKLRADEHSLHRRATDLLPELLKIVADQEAKRDARHTIEGTVNDAS